MIPEEIGETVDFLNVDLDIHSMKDLTPLVDALGRKVHILYCEKRRGGYFARLELSRQPRTPEEGIRGFATLVSGLGRAPTRLWAGATKREFSVGIQMGAKPWQTDYPLEPKTLALVSKVGGRIVFTLYGRPSHVIGPDGKTTPASVAKEVA